MRTEVRLEKLPHRQVFTDSGALEDVWISGK